VRSAKRVLAIVILSVRLSVLVSCPGIGPSPGEVETLDLPYDNCEFLVSVTSNDRINEGYSRKKSLFYHY